MTPKELKNSILQLAIEGKLVEQRKEEGTAEILYAEIQKEKQKLIKQGKIKKEKPLPEITDDEIPFEIPKSWKWVRLYEILKLENGDRSEKYPVEADYKKTGIPFFGAKDIEKGKLSFDNVRYISEKKFLELNNGKLKNNDIICLLRGYVGKTAIFNCTKENKTGFICAQMVILRLYSLLIIKYFNVYLKSNIFNLFVKNKTTGTAVRQLPANEIGNMIFPLPPLAEQKRIVEKIEELMPLVDRYEVLYNRLNELNKEFPKKLKNAVLQKAIEGKLVPQIKSEGTAEDLYKEIQKEKQKLIKNGKIKKEKPLPEITEDEMPFEIPKSWKWCRINECFDMYTGNSISENIKKSKYMKLTKGYNYIGTKDVSFEQEINYDNGVKIPYDEAGFKKAEKNSVLMCIEGGSAGRKIAITKEEVCFGNKLCKFNQFIGNNKYIFYYLQSPQFIEQFKENLTGIIGGVSIQKIKEIVFPLPPLPEQHRIVEKIEEILPNIEKLDMYN